MSPTVVRDGPFRLFSFFPREETRLDVHVAHPDGEAKFRLQPDAQVAVNMGLSPAPLRQAQLVVEVQTREIDIAWHRHLGK